MASIVQFFLILHELIKRPILPLHLLNGSHDLSGRWRQLSELDQVLFNDVDSLLVLPLLDPTGTELLLLPLLLEELQLCVSLGGELVLWALYPDSRCLSQLRKGSSNRRRPPLPNLPRSGLHSAPSSTSSKKLLTTKSLPGAFYPNFWQSLLLAWGSSGKKLIFGILGVVKSDP